MTEVYTGNLKRTFKRMIFFQTGQVMDSFYINGHGLSGDKVIKISFKIPVSGETVQKPLRASEG